VHKPVSSDGSFTTSYLKYRLQNYMLDTVCLIAIIFCQRSLVLNGQMCGNMSVVCKRERQPRVLPVAIKYICIYVYIYIFFTFFTKKLNVLLFSSELYVSQCDTATN